MRIRLAARLERRPGIHAAEAMGLFCDTLLLEAATVQSLSASSRRLLRRAGFRRLLTDDLAEQVL